MDAGEIINLDEAKAMTKEFRDTHPNEVKSFMVSKQIIISILQQSGCEGIRIYNAINDEGRNLVIVGVDDQEIDMYNGLLADRVWRCPPLCKDSPLSTDDFNGNI